MKIKLTSKIKSYLSGSFFLLLRKIYSIRIVSYRVNNKWELTRASIDLSIPMWAAEKLSKKNNKK